jgi:hypothetical protein
MSGVIRLCSFKIFDNAWRELPRPLAAWVIVKPKGSRRQLLENLSRMHRVVHGHARALLMIIQIIYAVDVPLFKAEDHPPGATDSDSVKSLSVAT